MSFEAFVAIILAINLTCAVVAALIAVRSGLDPFSWVLVGATLGPFGLVALLAVRSQGARESVKTSAPARPTSGPRIIVPVDGSDSSLAAVNYAIAHTPGGRITLLAVLPLDRADGPNSEPGSPRRTVFEQECTEQFAEALKRLEEAGVANETEVAFGDPADEILRVSTAEPYETVIIGRRGRGLSKMLLGSVSEKVLQKATIPVTVAD